MCDILSAWMSSRCVPHTAPGLYCIDWGPTPAEKYLGARKSEEERGFKNHQNDWSVLRVSAFLFGGV